MGNPHSPPRMLMNWRRMSCDNCRGRHPSPFIGTSSHPTTLGKPRPSSPTSSPKPASETPSPDLKPEGKAVGVTETVNGRQSVAPAAEVVESKVEVHVEEVVQEVEEADSH